MTDAPRDTEEDYKGYRSPGLDTLKKYNTRVWAEVQIDTKGHTYQGFILPRSETSDEFHIVLKLNTGYNVGVHVDSILDIRQIGYKKAEYKIPEKDFPFSDDKPHVTLLGTGGTIASRLDYQTGAVIPAFSPGELYGAVPELADICNLNTRKIFGVFSEDMGPDQYKILSEEIEKEINNGAQGIVIGHGTDTLGHSAAILSFMVQNLPVPVVFVGSQRSSDRPSSDAALNLINATKTAAIGDIAEVVVSMYGPTSDDYCLIHRGTRVRKMHSSYRSTFRTIADTPLMMVWPDRFKYIHPEIMRRDPSRKVKIDTAYNRKCTILYYYPGMNPDLIKATVDAGYEGVIIAGTGLGHVNHPIHKEIGKAIDQGVIFCMTVQTIWGYVHMHVYENGRKLLELGIIPLENMIVETAYMKLCWVMGHTKNPKEVKSMMLTPINHEITEREPYNGYMVLQGGIPEVDSFFATHRK